MHSCVSSNVIFDKKENKHSIVQCIAWLHCNVFILLIMAKLLWSQVSSQSTKFAQQSRFVTRLGAFPVRRLIRPSERLLSRLSGFLVNAFWLGRGMRFAPGTLHFDSWCLSECRVDIG